MRLIDADALMKFLCMAEECSKCPARNKDGVCENGLKPYQMCFAIQTAPTVNAVKVVRCGECKWWHEIDSVEGTTFGKCMRPHPINQEGWYCADGERKDNESEN